MYVKYFRPLDFEVSPRTERDIEHRSELMVNSHLLAPSTPRKKQHVPTTEPYSNTTTPSPNSTFHHKQKSNHLPHLPLLLQLLRLRLRLKNLKSPKQMRSLKKKLHLHYVCSKRGNGHPTIVVEVVTFYQQKTQ